MRSEGASEMVTGAESVTQLNRSEPTTAASAIAVCTGELYKYCFLLTLSLLSSMGTWRVHSLSDNG